LEFAPARAVIRYTLEAPGSRLESREAFKRYLARPSTEQLKTIAAFRAHYSAWGGGPLRVEANERVYDGLRKARMPKEGFVRPI
jgi:hypothetical protein